MSALTNGSLASNLLTAVAGTAYLLRKGPAAALAAAQAQCQRQYGWTPQIDSAYRDLTTQIRIFRERYTQQNSGSGPFGDVRYWMGARYVRTSGAAAAVPGTSNHGLGIAIDVVGLGAAHSGRWAQWAAVAQPLGWSWVEGSSIGEPWHWVYTGPADTVSNIVAAVPVTSPTTLPGPPAPLIPEDWFDMATADELRQIVKEETAKAVAAALPRVRTAVLAEVSGVEPGSAAAWYVVNYASRTYQPLGAQRLQLCRNLGLDEIKGQGALFLNGFTRIPG